MLSRKEFLSKPKYAALSNKEKQSRWVQYQETRRGNGKRNIPNAARAYSKIQSINPGAAALHLFPPCAVHYAQAMAAPFHLVESGAQSACIPDLHAVPSKKVHTLSKYVMSTGSTGVGFAISNPQCKSSDSGFCITTTSDYVGTTTLPVGGRAGDPILPTGAVATARLSRLPYTDANFQNATTVGVNARVVGFGMRIRHIGPELARAGQIVAFRESDNNHVLDGRTLDDIRNLETSRVYPVDKEWTYVHYRPVKPGEFEYSRWACIAENQAVVSPTPGPGAFNAYNMGFIITGTTTSGGTAGASPFELEVVSFIEYIGLIDQVTHTHSDIQALSQIRNSLPSKDSTRNPHRNLAKTLYGIGSNLLKHGSVAQAQAISESPSNQLLLAYRGNDKKGLNKTNTLEDRLFSGVNSIVGEKLGGMLRSGIDKAMPYIEQYAPQAIEYGLGKMLA